MSRRARLTGRCSHCGERTTVVPRGDGTHRPEQHWRPERDGGICPGQETDPESIRQFGEAR
jgi:hypothetical protein